MKPRASTTQMRCRAPHTCQQAAQSLYQADNESHVGLCHGSNDIDSSIVLCASANLCNTSVGKCIYVWQIFVLVYIFVATITKRRMLDQLPLYEGKSGWRLYCDGKQHNIHQSISLMRPFEFNSHVSHVITRVRSSCSQSCACQGAVAAITAVQLQLQHGRVARRVALRSAPHELYLHFS